MGLDYVENSTKNLKKDFVSLALKHVIFDGWSERTFLRTCSEMDYSVAELSSLFPRGGIDMAIFFHQMGDENFSNQFFRFKDDDLRISEKIENAIFTRLNTVVSDREVIKRSVGIFATPLYISDGTRMIWETSDKIWNLVGDDSRDFTWYSKRISLSTVFSSCLLYWLEDESTDFVNTRGFIDRRIRDIMLFEKFKGKIEQLAPRGVGNKINSKIRQNFGRNDLDWKMKLPGWLKN